MVLNPPGLFQPKRTLINYDYFDIAEGVGYVIYYGAKGDNGEYIITTTNALYSEEMATYIEDQTVAGTATKYFDLDFDLTFNRPKNIKGKIFANIPIGMSAISAVAGVFEFYAIVKAVHYDGSTETILATGTSRTVQSGLNVDTTAGDSMIALCVMDVTTLKHFKKGETLRFIVEGWFKYISGTNHVCHIMMGHDPRNRAFRGETRAENISIRIILVTSIDTTGYLKTSQNTQMIFHVPYVLDV